MKRRKRKSKPTLKRVLETRKGRVAASRFKRFWGVPITRATLKSLDVPGVKSGEPYVGLGVSPMLYVADGPQKSNPRIRKIKRRGILVADARGRRMAILSGRQSTSKRRLKKLGWIPQTDYLPFGEVEKAGSFKSNRHWQHKMGEAGGHWPVAHEDQAGNVWYSRGTYTVNKWIRN